MARELYKCLEDLAVGDGKSHLTFGSPQRLFSWGLNSGLISFSEHEQAKKIYGNLWDYSGD